MNRRKPETQPSTQAQQLKDDQTPIPKSKAKRTVNWHEIPPWQQDNAYITTGYRPPTNSFLLSAHSLLYIHNETVNIWTHLLGAVFALCACFYLHSLILPRYHLATATDLVVFTCYFGGAVACLGMSATYHTISNHSESVNRIGNQLDYVGIVCLIWGSFVPSIFYGFARRPQLIVVYLSMITIIGAGCVTVSVNPNFRTPKWRPFRAGMFVAMGLSAVVPVIHGIILFGVAQLQLQIGLSWLVLQGVLYVLGAAIYAARIPEKWKPGTFDIYGSSHQIFHVLVVLAASAHLVGLIKAFDYEHSARAKADDVLYGLRDLLGWK